LTPWKILIGRLWAEILELEKMDFEGNRFLRPVIGRTGAGEKI